MTDNYLDKRIQHIPAEIWTKIAKIDELKGQWKAGVRLSPQILNNLKKTILIASTGASTRIEGAKLSDEEIEKLMQGVSIQKLVDRDSQEVAGYYELLEKVFSSWQTIKFSENATKHFHKELLKYVSKDARHRGEYKKSENKVIAKDRAGRVAVIFETAPAYLTPKKMQELTEWTGKNLKDDSQHPLLIIGNFLVEFLKIHPFQDGNGRLSRVLTNLLLLQAGYLYMPYVSHEKLVEDNKSRYYLALRRSQKTFNTQREDITSWLDFFLEILLKQTEMAVKLLSRENMENILSPQQLKIWQCLDKITEISPAEIAQRTKIARPTINQALTKLLRLKKIERIGQGRTTRYRKL